MDPLTIIKEKFPINKKIGQRHNLMLLKSTDDQSYENNHYTRFLFELPIIQEACELSR